MVRPATHGGGPDLAPLRAALAPYGVVIDARRIQPGDEAAFADPGEVATAANLPRRRASGAARIVARRLLGELGSDAAAPLRRSPSGAPLWPEGIAGSLAHDDEWAVAAAARRARLAEHSVKGLGVDIEPAVTLPADLVAHVLSDEENRRTRGDGVIGRLIFACKEAVYKAIHPLDGSPLEYDDIEIRLGDSTAKLRDGRSLRLFTGGGARLVAVALA
jgi:4'-phosphopantetheinyl transferase EntD